MVANIIKKLHIYSVNINRKAIVHLDCMLRLWCLQLWKCFCSCEVCM